ncbi:urea transporter 1 isoform X2 [Camponotus floridanus]|uniref:urea transporter 1 isoform X2 n=1 Tax=Camponotus floridanus TaxID=104421 RepID=UPI00059E77D6|nr:urea transporter 1 isoform X2 [Camponotus floridanus]
MSAKNSTVELRQEKTWVSCVGDFAILKKFFAQKQGPIWYTMQLFEALLRGFGQVVFVNNPLGGLLIIVTWATVDPGTLALSVAAAVLGLLLSVVIREPRNIVENGLSVYNPVLVGSVSYVLIPQIYGAFDAFSFLLVFLGTILSVYLTRSLRSDTFACMTWPFNLVEIVLIFALSTQNGANELTKSMEPMLEKHNATSETTMTTMNSTGFYAESNDYVNWGMVFRGCVVSSAQVYGINNEILGAVIYLAMLMYSPTSTVFSFFGAFCGTLAGLQLGVDHDKVYNGIWGYNNVLTGSALGGNLFVLNGQTAAAAVMGIIFTSLVQYSLESIFINTQLSSVLTLPFVIATSFFFKLNNGKGDLTFPWPVPPMSFPEKQRHDYLMRQRYVKEEDTSEEFEVVIQNEEGPTQTDN